MLGSMCFFGYIYYDKISVTCTLTPDLQHIISYKTNVGAVIMLYATAFFSFFLVVAQALMTMVLYAQ